MVAVLLLALPPELLTFTQKFTEALSGGDENELLLVPTGVEVSPLLP
jgi:hypothetical protein